MSTSFGDRHNWLTASSLPGRVGRVFPASSGEFPGLVCDPCLYQCLTLHIRPYSVDWADLRFLAGLWGQVNVSFTS
jgi:hypothetical protein